MRLADNTDKNRILQYVSEEPEFNLFFIGDIENYGLEKAFCRCYMDEEKYRIKGLLLHYHRFLTPYTRFPSGKASKTLAKTIDTLIAKGAETVSGKKEVIDAIEHHLESKPVTTNNDYYAYCQDPQLMDGLPLKSVEFADEDDTDEIMDLFRRIPEFTPGDSNEEFRKSLKDGTRKTTIIKKDGRIVSTASYTAENSNSAMIIGVATAPEGEHRKKGYASACLTELLIDLSERGKGAALFYDNPGAGSIYRKMGFKNIGQWKMLRF